MKYAFTTFALIVTLLGGFIFGAYYMYRKNNPVPAEQVNEAPTEEEVLDDSAYYDSDGNWIFKYNTDQTGYGGNGSSIIAGGDASENIDYRITGTNFVYEDDGNYSGFHAVVTIENIGKTNLYLGPDSVFDIEDRNLEVVDSYDYVRAVPDVIAPGEKGYFYVPYGQIKTREDSVTIEEGDLSGDTPEPGEANSAPTNNDDNNSIDIDELEKALQEEGLTTSSVKVEQPKLLAAADQGSKASAGNSGTKSGGTELLPADESEGEASADEAASEGKKADDSKVDVKTADEAASEGASEGASGDGAKTAGKIDDTASEGKSNDEASSEGTSGDGKKPEESAADGSASEGSSDAGEKSEGTDETPAEGEEGEGTSEGATVNGTDGDTKKTKAEYPGLSLYRVHEYFIMPNLDIEKCANDPRKDFDIFNIMYGSNTSGYFTLSADVSNSTEKNVDYIPVTVVALDRRGNAIAVGKDSITDFYSGATRSFGVSYVLTREQRSNIVQCVVYAREAISK